MYSLLPPKLLELQTLAERLAQEVIAPRAAATDANSVWPAEGMRALAESGLTGLHVPAKFGGLGQGLCALAVISETLARSCASTSMCFGMHSVATAVIAAKATSYQAERFLVPIAKGKHLTTLALSESGTGSHFYLPQCQLSADGDDYVVNGTKQFVTSGGHADSYVISTKSSQADLANGEFNCLLVEKEQPGMNWLEPWQGFGMRGNSSRGLQLKDVRVSMQNLLGGEGDQIWYVFEVVAPYFLMAMAGTYLGIARAALDFTVNQLKQRRYQHSGEALTQVSVIQHRISELWLIADSARNVVYSAGMRADSGAADALVAVMMAKVAAAEAANQIAQQGMILCGGRAYRDNGELPRMLRDAAAAHVMSPTTDILKSWAGKALLGLPLI
jgi:isovaleryl-CoA dehydrogenase